MRSIVCITESSYGGALTRGATYEVVDADDGKRQFRVRDDRGRLRWYPATCFADGSQAVNRLSEYVIDDAIEDPSDDWVEVTVTLSDGARRWCAFTTPARVARAGDDLTAGDGAFHVFFGARHALIVSRISPPVIEAMLHHLDRQGRLEECTLKLE